MIRVSLSVLVPSFLLLLLQRCSTLHTLLLLLATLSHSESLTLNHTPTITACPNTRTLEEAFSLEPRLRTTTTRRNT